MSTGRAFLAPGAVLNSRCSARSFDSVKQMPSLLLPLLVITVAFVPLSAPADETSHRAAAERLLQLMQIDQLMAQSREQLLQLQVRQHPELASFESQLRKFFDRHLGWENVKDDIIRIYMAEFPEGDLKEMIAFYDTPVGRRAVKKMPALVEKTTEVTRNRLREHLPELQEALREAAAPESERP